MNTKIVIFIDPSKPFGKLTKIFTGCYAYHTAFLQEESGYIYDMYLMRRRRYWDSIKKEYEGKYLIYDSPIEILEDYFVNSILNRSDPYGFKDYLLFGLRPIYHLFGKSTRNEKGVVCSEMILEDLASNGWLDMPKEWKEIPSPCDWYNLLK